MWTYLSEDGEVLARVSRVDVPPIGYPVTIVGRKFAPAENYKVVKINEAKRELVLAQ